MTSVSCDGQSCCPCPAESEAILKRDGVLYLVCLECHAEKGPAPAITCAAITPAVTGAPCGEDIPRLDMDDIAHRWGSPL